MKDQRYKSGVIYCKFIFTIKFHNAIVAYQSNDYHLVQDE